MCLPVGAQVSKETLRFDIDSEPGRDLDRHPEFLDGAPLPETAEKVYDYLDTMRGVDAFLKGMPGASLHGLIKGAHDTRCGRIQPGPDLRQADGLQVALS